MEFGYNPMQVIDLKGLTLNETVVDIDREEVLIDIVALSQSCKLMPRNVKKLAARGGDRGVRGREGSGQGNPRPTVSYSPLAAL
ncbi:hypothetical protein EVAR_29227_1 [Eumeta japonica]|uniref:Uncharacterized protein n=1 Tax=Eumeta variegata TaxID=151549 RepID=A0A4C1VI04_EUMVA|nr:hypothetical protein EVAR_29227_1 [Eumeta japonica]